MTAAAKPATNQQRGDRAIEVRVAAKLENLAVLRTLVGAVGTFEDLDFDAVADLRLAVDEATVGILIARGWRLAPTKRKGPDDNPGRGVNGGR